MDYPSTLSAINQSTPSPLRGGIKGGGAALSTGSALPDGSASPLPTSPTREEVPFSVWDSIEPNTLRGTSPLMGEARKGWGSTRQPAEYTP